MDVNSLEARPGYSLANHLVGTSKICNKWLRFASQKLSLPLSEVGELIGLLHDFGKACPEFQKKLRGEQTNPYLSQHSLLSAFLSYYAIKIRFDSIPWYIPFLSYMTVKRHHGQLQNVAEEFVFDNNDRELLQKQIELIRPDTFDSFAEQLDVNLSYKSAKNHLMDFKKELWVVEDEWDTHRGDLMPYTILNLLYSTLIDADRSEVIFHGEIGDYPSVIPSELVDRYKSAHLLTSRERIDKMRDVALHRGTQTIQGLETI